MKPKPRNPSHEPRASIKSTQRCEQTQKTRRLFGPFEYETQTHEPQTTNHETTKPRNRILYKEYAAL